ncbi:MAG: methyltransferase domain-containing protein [Planctomycetes bacterium]|nr:methyltransferase domain-containing protein [Planctomycetota bacterium]
MEKLDARGLERRFEDRLRSDPGALDAPEAADRVLEAAGPLRGLRVLDAGCGSGRLCRRLADRGAIVSGVDVCGNLLRRSRDLVPEAELLQADVRTLPFGEGRFDLATSLLVLHYLEDPERALQEIARVLRPRGRLLVCDRICSADPVLGAAQLGLERLRNPLIHRILSAQELEGLLSRSGFEILREGEFRRTEPVESWLSGTEPVRARALREEIGRLRGRDLGGLRVASTDGIELRMALVEARRD